MAIVEVKLRRDPRVSAEFTPRYQTDSSVGVDVHAFLEQPLVILPRTRELIPTGLYMEIPVGYEIQIRPRSGLAHQTGITVLNAPGTIDSDYRGEIKILLINHGEHLFTVLSGDRIAQMVISKVDKIKFIHTQELSKTGRGVGGFGSTEY